MWSSHNKQPSFFNKSTVRKKEGDVNIKSHKRQRNQMQYCLDIDSCKSIQSLFPGNWKM